MRGGRRRFPRVGEAGGEHRGGDALRHARRGGIGGYTLGDVLPSAGVRRDAGRLPQPAPARGGGESVRKLVCRTWLNSTALKRAHVSVSTFFKFFLNLF